MENEVPATCTASGSYDSVVYCSVCGEELSRTVVAVPGGHNYVISGLERKCTGCGDLFDGFYDDYIFVNGQMQKAYQMVQVDDEYFFVDEGNKILRNVRVYLKDIFLNGSLLEGAPGWYYFDDNGALELYGDSIVNDYLYVDNKMKQGYQLVKLGDDFYFVGDSHKVTRDKTVYLDEEVVKGKFFAPDRAIQPGNYYFDAEGKMVVPEMKDGVTAEGYLYIKDVKQLAYHLVSYNGDYYFVDAGNKILKNTRVYLSAQILDGTGFAAGYYYFDAEGKMLMNGVVDDYLYVNGTMKQAYRLVKLSDEAYYFVDAGNKILKNARVYLNAQYLEGTGFEAGYYYFKADGTMLMNGIVDDHLYVNGTMKLSYRLVQVGEDYYFVDAGHKILKGVRVYLGAQFLDGTGLAAGYYNFDTDGKMIIG